MAYTEVMRKRIYTNNDQLRAGHAQLAQSMDVKLFITLATNQQMPIEKMKLKTREFMARLDRSKLGRNWAKHDRRMDGLFYVEHEQSNIHVHGLLTRTCCNRYGLQLAADDIWNDMCGSGSVVLKDIHEVKRFAAYCTKEYLRHGFFALTDSDLIRAFDGTNYNLSSHVRAQMRDSRLTDLGFNTLNDVRQIFNRGQTFDAGDGAVGRIYKGVSIIMDPSSRTIITIRPGRRGG